MWTGNPHRLKLTRAYALAALDGALRVEHADEGAEITVLLLQDDGSAVPVARGTVRRGTAILPFVSPALQQVDPNHLILSASRDNAVIVELRARRSLN